MGNALLAADSTMDRFHSLRFVFIQLPLSASMRRIVSLTATSGAVQNHSVHRWYERAVVLRKESVCRKTGQLAGLIVMKTPGGQGRLRAQSCSAARLAALACENRRCEQVDRFGQNHTKR